MKTLSVFFAAIFIMCSVTVFAQKQNTSTDSAVYTCPMHPSVKQQKAGKCPQCGMALTKVEDKYVCPMHADITANKAGKCSKCGMSLVKVEEKVYSCPMHAGETSSKPGKCSKCGMALKEKAKTGDQ